jgi:hypothetical protein
MKINHLATLLQAIRFFAHAFHSLEFCHFPSIVAAAAG